HALGATYRGRHVGSYGDMTTFSFHPTKLITTGEGGMVTTNDSGLAARLQKFRNHAIDRGTWAREAEATWEYDVVDLGYNYRLSELHCALGLSQLSHVSSWLTRRGQIAARYGQELADVSGLHLPAVL